MWVNGRWEDDGMTNSQPASVTPDALRDAAAQLRAVAEAATGDEYAATLGIKHRQRDQLTGGALALEAVAAQAEG